MTYFYLHLFCHLTTEIETYINENIFIVNLKHSICAQRAGRDKQLKGQIGNRNFAKLASSKTPRPSQRWQRHELTYINSLQPLPNVSHNQVTKKVRLLT